MLLSAHFLWELQRVISEQAQRGNKIKLNYNLIPFFKQRVLLMLQLVELCNWD